MSKLEKKNNIEKYSEKKSYKEPQLKEIGKVQEMTKGGSKRVDYDGFTYLQLVS